MSKYQAYSEYKDSGSKLLGDVPEHWQLSRVKYVAEITPKKPIVDRSLKCSFIPMEKLKTDSIILDETKQIDTVYDGYTYFADGDILMAKVTPCFENKNIAIAKGLTNKIGFGSSEIYTIRASEKVVNRFLYYRLQEDGFMDLAIGAMTGAGGLKRVPSEVVANYIYASPEDGEQQKIANFLDHETAKIDTLIEKQQQLIKLLKEKRQAVISHAVTKGLNPNAPMRDSGVEWLGEVPEHWAMPKISHIGRVLNGSTPDKSNLSYWEGGAVPWLASGCLNSEIVDEPSHLISEAAYQNSSVELIPTDSLLVGMVGQGKTRGTSAILAINSCINQNMAAIIPNEKVKIRFLYFLFQAMYDDLRELGRGGNQAALNCEIISSIRIPLPPIEEQTAIVDMLDELLIKLGDTDTLGEVQITLLQERRTALISAAVTGKIDVRNWKAV
jgi:type I restriction enzyme, S subunit